MFAQRLSVDEVQKMRTLSELMHINQQGVADLCERQIQENSAQQAKDISVMLASLQPLQPSRPKTPIVKTAPKGKVAKTMPPPPVVVKQPPGASGVKAPPPVLASPMAPPPPKDPPAQQQSGDKHGSDKGPPPSSLPLTKFAGGLLPARTSPKGPSTSQLQKPLISPKGRPPARIAIPSQPAPAAIETPRSDATEATADLEEKLKRRREAKRQQSEMQEEEQQDGRD